MSGLVSLIERVEKATGSNRDLDAEIASIFDPAGDEAAVSEAATLNGRDYPDRYTSSIDAVVALIERACGKYDWSLFCDNGAALAGCQPASEDGVDLTDTHGATPALALLLAFLKAKEAEQSVKGGEK